MGGDHGAAVFDRVPARAMDPEILRVIGPTGYVVLGVLAHHADREGCCWPGIERIMMMIGIRSDRTVHAALDRLEGADLILRRRRPGKPTEYRLIFTPATNRGGARDCGAQEIAVAQGDAPTPAVDCATPPQPAAGEPDTGTRYRNQSSLHHPAPGSRESARGQGRDDAWGGGQGYVEEILAAYTGLPMTPDRATPADRRTAEVWEAEDIPVEAVRGALVLAASRWLATDPQAGPIQSLKYFDKPVHEAAAAEDPAYWAYLEDAQGRITEARTR